jgi:hypothetical protein
MIKVISIPFQYKVQHLEAQHRASREAKLTGESPLLLQHMGMERWKMTHPITITIKAPLSHVWRTIAAPILLKLKSLPSDHLMRPVLHEMLLQSCWTQAFRNIC